jgi:hypothetical protein
MEAQIFSKQKKGYLVMLSTNFLKLTALPTGQAGLKPPSAD